MMKQTPLLLTAAVVAVLAGGLTNFALDQVARADSKDSSAAVEQPRADLAEELAGLLDRQAALENRLEELASRPRAAAATPEEIGAEAVDAAIARWLESHPDAAETLGLASKDGGGELEGPAIGPEEFIDLLLAGELRGMNEQEVWARLREEGRLDEVVAELERLAELDPTNPELRLHLGNAYLQKIFEVGNGPMAGVWGAKADAAFDVALELDPEHWEARFTKAVSLSNWPTFMGKTGEAIAQFEVLVEQQRSGTTNPNNAQTYYFLGNLHQRQGNLDKALEVWREGLQLYPEDSNLAKQIQIAEGTGGN